MRECISTRPMRVLLFHLLVFFTSIVQVSHAAQTKEPQSTNTYWEEIVPSNQQLKVAKQTHFNEAFSVPSKRPRKLVWCGRYDGRLTWMPTRNFRSNFLAEPHPMRTDLWKLSMDWKDRAKRKAIGGGRTMELEFHENGYVRGSLSSEKDNAESDSEVVGIGKWEVQPWGVAWTIHDEAINAKYSFYADILVNPFGEQPKMIKGVVLKESGPNAWRDPGQDSFAVRRLPVLSWFRPVVGTFKGVGTGRDTADLSYRKRGPMSE